LRAVSQTVVQCARQDHSFTELLLFFSM